jgi:hypothetical protein
MGRQFWILESGRWRNAWPAPNSSGELARTEVREVFVAYGETAANANEYG